MNNKSNEYFEGCWADPRRQSVNWKRDNVFSLPFIFVENNFKSENVEELKSNPHEWCEIDPCAEAKNTMGKDIVEVSQFTGMEVKKGTVTGMEVKKGTITGIEDRHTAASFKDACDVCDTSITTNNKNESRLL